MKAEIIYLNDNYYKIKERFQAKDELQNLENNEDNMLKRAEELSRELGAKKEWCVKYVEENPELNL